MKSKEKKREEAEVRQLKYDGLKAWEKELILAARPGDSLKERARLFSK